MRGLLSECGRGRLEFAYADFEDKRLGKRFLEILDALSKKPEGILLGALKCSFNIKATYRFFDNEKTSYEQVLVPRIQATKKACSISVAYLFIEDTTNVSFNVRSSITSIGQHTTAESQGLLLHSTFAFSIKKCLAQDTPLLVKEIYPLALKILSHKYTRLQNDWTDKSYYTCIAGFVNRKGDGLPDW
jgi:hypothetical protein